MSVQNRSSASASETISADSNGSWHTDNYLITLALSAGRVGSARVHAAPPKAEQEAYSGPSDNVVALAAAAPVGDMPPADLDKFAPGASTAIASSGGGDPLVLASLCDLLYDEPGQSPKPGWTAAQWDAALQQQPWTASWHFLATSSCNEQLYFGAAFENSDIGQIVIASRGSQTGYDFLVSDLDILRGIVPPAFHAAEGFARQIVQAYQCNGSQVLVTGHSLGGADAEYQGAKLGLAGATFAALGARFAASECAANLVDYLYPQDAVANLAPHIGSVAYVAPNGPAQWQDLIETLPFDGEGLHFINNYLEHFGAPGVQPITHAQFIEAVLLSGIVDYVSGHDGAPGQLASEIGSLLRSSGLDTQFGFDELAWPGAVPGATADASTQGGASGGQDWALAEMILCAALSMPTIPPHQLA
jgi:hypothetical protein